jgi:hypothetical protein
MDPKFCGDKQLEKTRRKWENNIKMELKVMIFGLINCSHSPRLREQ